MSKVTSTVWQFSLSCIMSKKYLLMKWVYFVRIICCWWRLYLNWKIGPLLKVMLLFFHHFFTFKLLFKRHEGNISAFNCSIIIIIIFFNCNLMSRISNTHFNDFTIFSFHEWDSFPEEISWSQLTIHSPEYHNIMSMKCKH